MDNQFSHEYPETAETIARAKRAQQAERDEAFRRTGLRIVGQAPMEVHAYTIVCPNCLSPIGAESEGKATRAFGRHFVNAHVTRVQ